MTRRGVHALVVNHGTPIPKLPTEQETAHQNSMTVELWTPERTRQYLLQKYGARVAENRTSRVKSREYGGTHNVE